MNTLQRSAYTLGKRARREAEIWNSAWVLFVMALTVATGLASWAVWGVVR